MKKKCLLSLLVLCLASCKLSNTKLQGFIDSDPIYLNSPVSGRLVKLNIADGDYVNSGESAFILHDGSLKDKEQTLVAELNRNKAILADSTQGMRQSALLVLEANLEQAQARYDLAIARYERALKLKDKGAIDQDKFDGYKFEKIRLAAQVAEAKANIIEAKKGARVNLKKANEAAVIASEFNLKQLQSKLKQQIGIIPKPGYILDTFYSVGEWVPSFKPIASLVDPNDLFIKFYLPISLLRQVNVGDEIDYQIYGSNKLHKAKVSFISSEATYTPPMVFSDDNNEKYVYLVRAKVNKSKLLRLGQPVTVIW